jgi:hypothetical protein
LAVVIQSPAPNTAFPRMKRSTNFGPINEKFILDNNPNSGIAYFIASLLKCRLP